MSEPRRIQEFHLGTILTVVGPGVCLAPRVLGGLQELLDYLTGDGIHQPQIPRAMSECREPLLEQPALRGLRDIVYPTFGDPILGREWIDTQIARFGALLPVSPLAAENHTSVPILEELTRQREADPDAAPQILPITILTAEPGERRRLSALELASAAATVAREAFRDYRAEGDPDIALAAARAVDLLASASQELCAAEGLVTTAMARTKITNGGRPPRRMKSADALECARGFDAMEWAELWLSAIGSRIRERRPVDLKTNEYARALNADVQIAQGSVRVLEASLEGRRLPG